MKTWKLDWQQRVSTDLQRNVYFKHYGRHVRGISLSWRQFLNLHDVIRDLDTFRRMKYYPLGERIWLQHSNRDIQLYHCHLNSTFTFHESSWNKYIKETHQRIYSFLRNASPSLHNCQHAKANENLFKDDTQPITSTHTQQQTLSRTASNACGEIKQQSKRSNLPEWDSADSRRPFSFINSVHALRTTTNPATDMEEGELFDIASECGQHCDFYSIE